MKIYLEELEKGDVITLTGQYTSARIVRNNDWEPFTSISAPDMADTPVLRELSTIAERAMLIVEILGHFSRSDFITWLKKQMGYTEGLPVYPPTPFSPDLEAAAEAMADGSVKN